MQTLNKARLCLGLIMERKALDPLLLEMGELTSFADYFVIASGNSSRQVQAISRHVQQKMREAGFRHSGTEGEKEGHWVLLDYDDVVVHLFYQPIREFYGLESLWVEAPRISLENQESGGA